MTGRRNSSIITHELLLHDAASLGDERKLDDLKVFIKRGKFDIDFRDEDWGGRTTLHCASEQGNYQCHKKQFFKTAVPKLTRATQSYR